MAGSLVKKKLNMEALLGNCKVESARVFCLREEETKEYFGHFRSLKDARKEERSRSPSNETRVQFVSEPTSTAERQAYASFRRSSMEEGQLRYKVFLA